MKKNLTGFDIERWRKELLSSNKLQELKTTYSKKYPQIPGSNTPEFWDEKFSGDNTYLFPMAYARNKMVAESVQTGSRVLNLGAGKGYLENFVYERVGDALEWVGTDFTNIEIKELRANFPSYTFKKTGLLKLPFTENYFDTICLLEVLEHIAPEETFSVLEEICRVLKTGGTVIVSVPLNEGLEEMMPDNPNAHKRDYSPELLRYELETSGFKIAKQQTLSAFGSFYALKHFINSIFKLRKPNNVVVWAQK